MKSDIDFFDIKENEWKNQTVREMDRTHIVNSMCYLDRAITERQTVQGKSSYYTEAFYYIKTEIEDMTAMFHNLAHELERQSK